MSFLLVDSTSRHNTKTRCERKGRSSAALRVGLLTRPGSALFARQPTGPDPPGDAPAHVFCASREQARPYVAAAPRLVS